MIRIAIAEDQAMIRQALVQLLNLEDDMTVQVEAEHGAQLLELMTDQIDVALVDVEMPHLDGLTTCATIKRRWPAARVLIVTTFGRPGYVRRAFEAGAGGFVVKDAPLPDLLDAIRKVARGERVVDQRLAVETLTRGESPLTPRETDVLQAYQGGRSSADIAQLLGLNRGTVRNYISAAMDKTGAASAAEAARVAKANGWLEPGTN